MNFFADVPLLGIFWDVVLYCYSKSFREICPDLRNLFFRWYHKSFSNLMPPFLRFVKLPVTFKPPTQFTRTLTSGIEVRSCGHLCSYIQPNITTQYERHLWSRSGESDTRNKAAGQHLFWNCTTVHSGARNTVYPNKEHDAALCNENPKTPTAVKIRTMYLQQRTRKSCSQLASIRITQYLFSNKVVQTSISHECYSLHKGACDSQNATGIMWILNKRRPFPDILWSIWANVVSLVH